MEGLILPKSPEKVIKTAVSTQASAVLVESVPTDRSASGKSAPPVLDAKTDGGGSQNGEKAGLQFPIGILKECEVQGELLAIT